MSATTLKGHSAAGPEQGLCLGSLVDTSDTNSVLRLSKNACCRNAEAAQNASQRQTADAPDDVEQCGRVIDVYNNNINYSSNNNNNSG